MYLRITMAATGCACSTRSSGAFAPFPLRSYQQQNGHRVLELQCCKFVSKWRNNEVGREEGAAARARLATERKVISRENNASWSCTRLLRCCCCGGSEGLG